jgi:subtilase family serine protease
LQIGGTSAAAPLWAAIAALTDHQIGGRLGLFNYFLYFFDSASGYTRQFHDITVGDNGYYPAGADYDMATGIGTANIAFLEFSF